MIATAGWQLYSHRQETGDWLKLGLDLQGGMHLVLEVDDPEGTMTSEAKADMIDRVDRIIRTRIDEFGVNEPLIQKSGNERLIVELAGISDEDQAKSIVTRNAFLEFKLVLPLTEMQAALPRIDRSIVRVLGVDSIRAMGRDVIDRGESIEDILFRTPDTVSVDSVAPEDPAAVDSAQAAADSAQAEVDALAPFSSLLNFGDIEGTFLVSVEDVPAARAAVARSSSGDRYREFYAGLNYFFYGHKLKLQSGVQLGDMNDDANDGGSYSGVAVTPCLPPASIRSWGTPSSATHHITFCRLNESLRPQILSTLPPRESPSVSLEHFQFGRNQPAPPTCVPCSTVGG